MKFGTRQQWLAGITGSATLFVALTAFRLSYDGSRGAALDAGMTPQTAGWLPVNVEGVLTVAAICTVVIGGWLPWSVMISFSGLSVLANVEHALNHGAGGWFSLLIAATPPAALPLCVHLAVGAIRKLAATSGAGTAPAYAVALAAAAHLHWLTTRPSKPAVPTSGSVAAPGQGGEALDTPASLPGQPATPADPGAEVAPGQELADRPPAAPVHPAEDTTTTRPVYLTAVPEDSRKDISEGVPASTARTRRARAARTPGRTQVVAPVGVPEDAELVSRLRVLREDTGDPLTTVRPVVKALGVGKDRARRVLDLDATTPPNEGEQ